MCKPDQEFLELSTKSQSEDKAELSTKLRVKLETSNQKPDFLILHFAWSKSIHLNSLGSWPPSATIDNHLIDSCVTGN